MHGSICSWGLTEWLQLLLGCLPSTEALWISAFSICALRKPLQTICILATAVLAHATAWGASYCDLRETRCWLPIGSNMIAQSPMLYEHEPDVASRARGGSSQMTLVYAPHMRQHPCTWLARVRLSAREQPLLLPDARAGNGPLYPQGQCPMANHQPPGRTGAGLLGSRCVYPRGRAGTAGAEVTRDASFRRVCRGSKAAPGPSSRIPGELCSPPFPSCMDRAYIHTHLAHAAHAPVGAVSLILR